MKRLQSLVSATCIAALLTVCAVAPALAQTYRSVGPDGKITFSDRKPTDPTQQTRQLGQKQVAPLLAPSPELFDLRPASKAPVLRSTVGEGQVTAVDIGGHPFPPGLPEAILDVLVHQFFVQSLVETCSRARPAFTERYQGAVRNWRDRNGEILAKSNHVNFTRFTGEQRDLLRATARQRLAPLMPQPGALEAERDEWCDRMSTDLARRQFELVGDMRLAPLLNFETP
jgi:hypothetical protein